MKIIPISNDGAFQLANQNGFIAEVTYPNGALGKVCAQIGNSSIVIRIKYSPLKLVKFFFLRVKEYGMLKDDIERGAIETEGRHLIKVIWDPLSPKQISTYHIDIEQTGISSRTLSLLDKSNQALMIIDYNFKLSDLREEIDLQVLPSDLLQEQVEELAIYFIQLAKWYEEPSLGD